jgi:hypothetical protein
MGRMSSTKDIDSSEKMTGVAVKSSLEEDKENGYAGKPARTATKDADERIVWDEV